MKISYIITTIRPFQLGEITINSIQSLGKHDHEIIVTSPYDYIFQCNRKQIRYVPDHIQTGSVAANNNALLEAEGDWLIFLPDDFHLINLDIDEFIEFLNSDRMQNKTFQMFSFHPRSGHKIEHEEYHTPVQHPYQIMHFPCVSKDTLQNKLNNVIFNDNFNHSYVDHWLGFYAAQHEKYEPYNYSLFKDQRSTFILLNTGHQYRNHSFDDHDYNVLKGLYEKWQTDNTIPYNAQL